MVGNVFGYDTYMIVEGSLKNVADNKGIEGFEVRLRLANYRGYLLSQIEDVRISIDGRPMERDAITLTLNGRSYTLEEMENTTDDRWGILDEATLLVRLPGGLEIGDHEVAVEEHIRASYIPMVAVASSRKTMSLA